MKRGQGNMRRAEMQSRKTRPPAVAGLFYPNNPNQLQTDVWDLLAAVAPPPPGGQ